MNSKIIAQHTKRLGEQLERTRLLQNIAQIDLAKLAGISERTLRRLESGQGGSIDSLIRLLTALKLDDSLLDLIPDHTVRPMERIRQTKTERQRASRSSKTRSQPIPKSKSQSQSKSQQNTPPKPISKQKTNWTWGDEQS